MQQPAFPLFLWQGSIQHLWNLLIFDLALLFMRPFSGPNMRITAPKEIPWYRADPSQEQVRSMNMMAAIVKVRMSRYMVLPYWGRVNQGSAQSKDWQKQGCVSVCFDYIYLNSLYDLCLLSFSQQCQQGLSQPEQDSFNISSPSYKYWCTHKSHSCNIST